MVSLKRNNDATTSPSSRGVPTINTTKIIGMVSVCYMVVFFLQSILLPNNTKSVATTPQREATSKEKPKLHVVSLREEWRVHTKSNKLRREAAEPLSNENNDSNNKQDKHDKRSLEKKTIEVPEPPTVIQEKRSDVSLSVSPWNDSPVLPAWMKDYMAWHAEALHNMTLGTNKWSDYDYFVVRCLESDDICGGTADRLRPLPYFLLASYRNKRLLFFLWERPAALEEYLVPPPGGLNWLWPPHPDLANHTFKGPDIWSMLQMNHLMGYHAPDESDKEKTKTFHPPQKVASVRVQSHFHGALEYNAMRSNNETESDYRQVFHDAWKATFVPSKPVQSLIDKRMEELELTKDQYHAVHIRAHYANKPTNVNNLGANAVNCLAKYLTELRHDNPLSSNSTIFVASDTKESTRAAVNYARRHGLPHTTSLAHTADSLEEHEDHKQPTLHLDRGTSHVSRKTNEWTKHEVHEYYDTFVDLYLLAGARCMVYNVGNYGKWANLLSSDFTCEYSHLKDRKCKMPESIGNPEMTQQQLILADN